ncbi:MAG TPA: DUF131 domain-containing protein [Candidatus Caldiarchaeum subterraneum]|uniref:DUF131 domain-containing protein n=1 Tax=Caldiarchaeum subterraneum TaxID=311458 RepID=A0A833EAL7_CALS0|nr:DUF131 domain-containing protein [Candidatus Caldarchaeum subterraneum]
MADALILLVVPLILVMAVVLLVLLIFRGLGEGGESNAKGVGVFLIGPIPIVVSGGKGVLIALLVVVLLSLVFILFTFGG